MPAAIKPAPQFARGHSQIPHDSEVGQQREYGKVNVDLPPAKSMPSRVRAVVVVVVPSIAKREESNNEVILAVVSGFISAAAVAMANRICRPDGMIHAYLADDATPNEKLKPARTAVQKKSPPCLAAQIQQ